MYVPALMFQVLISLMLLSISSCQFFMRNEAGASYSNIDCSGGGGCRRVGHSLLATQPVVSNLQEESSNREQTPVDNRLTAKPLLLKRKDEKTIKRPTAPSFLSKKKSKVTSPERLAAPQPLLLVKSKHETSSKVRQTITHTEVDRPVKVVSSRPSSKSSIVRQASSVKSTAVRISSSKTSSILGQSSSITSSAKPLLIKRKKETSLKSSTAPRSFLPKKKPASQPLLEKMNKETSLKVHPNVAKTVVYSPAKVVSSRSSSTLSKSSLVGQSSGKSTAVRISSSRTSSILGQSSKTSSVPRQSPIQSRHSSVIPSSAVVKENNFEETPVESKRTIGKIEKPPTVLNRKLKAPGGSKVVTFFKKTQS